MTSKYSNIYQISHKKYQSIPNNFTILGSLSTPKFFFTVFVSLNLYGKPKRLKDEMDPSHPTMDWKTLI